MTELHELGALETRDRIAAGETSEAEVTQAYLSRIEESELNAFITVDQNPSSDGRGPLRGVPVAVKDIFCTRGMQTTCGSQVLRGFVPPYDATVVRRLRDAGAVVIGKTNLDEFAMGSSNENSSFGPVRNPVDSARVPGGSSGGSAAAVAGNLAAAAIGTDTGGSIRQPASLCGCVGLKPTYGHASRYGMIAFASSLDQAGPMTKTVADAALLGQIMCGPDSADSTCTNREPGDWLGATKNPDVNGLRVAVPKEYFAEGIDAVVAARIRSVIDQLADAGAEIVDVSLPHSQYAVATYYIVATAEASSNLARYDGVRYGQRVDTDDLIAMYESTRAAGFGAEVKRRILLGTYVLSAGYYDAYYRKAMQVRTLIRQDFDRVFQQADVIIGPVSPTPAWKLGERMDDPLSMYLSDIYTIAINLAGLPGISVPTEPTGEGLPIGVQLIAPAFEEARLLRTAAWIEAS